MFSTCISFVMIWNATISSLYSKDWGLCRWRCEQCVGRFWNTFRSASFFAPAKLRVLAILAIWTRFMGVINSAISMNIISHWYKNFGNYIIIITMSRNQSHFCLWHHKHSIIILIHQVLSHTHTLGLTVQHTHNCTTHTLTVQHTH